MITTYYEIGRSGRGPSCVCPSWEDLLRLGEALPPGDYWIAVTEQFEDLLGGSRRETTDWGTLSVRGPGDWTLQSLEGLKAGPGYLIT